jgi:arsenate reductase (glutaredoxin)
MLKIYTYGNCSTCRQALQWLRAEGLAFTERPIRETPPTRAELERMLAAQGGEVRRLCNTSGRDYRELKLGEKLPGLGAGAVLALLERNGNLVKRPFLLGPAVALVGFDAAAWRQALAAAG